MRPEGTSTATVIASTSATKGSTGPATSSRGSRSRSWGRPQQRRLPAGTPALGAVGAVRWAAVWVPEAWRSQGACRHW
jgi:hypothetical protein